MSTTYTLEQRAGISAALQSCLVHLWDGVSSKKLPVDQERFICHALTKAGRFVIEEKVREHYQLAKDLILQRMEGAYTLETWLRKKGYPTDGPKGYSSAKRMQQYRHAWVLHLVAEFEVQRTIYACKCGCTRLQQDASVSVNNPKEVQIMDGVSCPECFYDGRYYMHVPVSRDYELGDDLEPEYMAKHGVEVTL